MSYFDSFSPPNAKKTKSFIKSICQSKFKLTEQYNQTFYFGGCVGNIVPVSPTKNSQSPRRNVYLDIQIQDSPNEKNKFV